ncbi:MAG TPA: metalloregulator ArsR/SmtB family transcription factor [Stellaceae bacterium]|nr:metalloregulator ArsR/SmtB family transcription factor [Stellaceae bacterium]
MSTLGPKQALFAQFAAIAKTLSNGHRLELLEQVAQGERSVEILAERTGLSVANASQHLQHLKRAGLLNSRRQGKFVYYMLADDGILEVLTALRRIAERNVAEVEQVVRSYFNKLDDLEPVTRKQLLKLIRAGAVTVLDVRPPDEFALGHVPGAVNIPLASLRTRLAEINPDREIIAYCRGHYCVLSFEAVAQLRARGFKARRLEDGLPEWRAAGLPITTGSARDR